MTRTQERRGGLAVIGLALAFALAAPAALAKGPPNHASEQSKGNDREKSAVKATHAKDNNGEKSAAKATKVSRDEEGAIVIDENGRSRVSRSGREAIGGIILDVLGVEEVVDDGEKSKKGKDGLPPGLAKRRTLPPGLAKQVEETGSLPPGLQKRLTGDLNERFRGYNFDIDGKRLTVTDEKTGKVLEVIDDVLELGRIMGRNSG